MLLNYLKIALRSLLKSKGFSFILLFGLVIGLTASFLIFLYVDFELSYDKYHPKASQLYRVYTANYDDEKGIYTYEDAMSFNLSGPTLKEEFAEITHYARVFDMAGGINFRIKDKIFQEEQAMFVDSGFIDLFKINWIAGDQKGAFSNSYSIVLTQKAAEKYFGNQGPLGQLMEVTSGQFQGIYQVNGIIEDIPDNTHLYFETLISYPTLWQSGIEPNWNNFGDYTYFRVEEGTDIDQLNEKLFPLSKNYLSEGTTLHFQLQPVTDIHLHSNMSYEAEVNGDANTVYFLIVIGVFILFIAWVNYINLTTAKAMERAREVGLRKVIGADRKTLVIQFLLEAVLINFFAMVVAILFTDLFKPWFSEFTGKPFPSFFNNVRFIWLCLGTFVVGVFLSGFYPAIIQSSFQPAQVLKGNFKTSKIGLALRKTLVVFQFTASFFLIAGTFIVYEQIRHMQNKDKGMNLEQIIVLPTNTFSFSGDSLSDDRFKTFKNSILPWSDVENISTSSSIPAGGISNIGSVSGGIWWDKKITDERYTYYIADIDDAFIPIYEINLLAGRNFSQEIISDTGQVVIVNEAARQLLGFEHAEQAINEYISIPRQGGRRKHQVIGVINNFNRQSLKFDVEPTIYSYNGMENGIFYSIKTSSTDYNALLNKLREIWQEQFPYKPFEYFFADQAFNNQFRSDLKFGQVFSIFSGLAILIACMGLYGLAYLMAINKTKEIGIRKTLGASVVQILILLSKSFVKLAFLAFLIGVPIVWWIMSKWLSSYAYHTNVKWWSLTGSGIIMLIIILCTVGFHTVKAARANPVEALRTE